MYLDTNMLLRITHSIDHPRGNNTLLATHTLQYHNSVKIPSEIMKHLAKFYEGKNLMFGAFVEHFVIFLRVGEALDQRGVEKTLK